MKATNGRSVVDLNALVNNGQGKEEGKPVVMQLKIPGF
jgi:hypothetical protein